MTFYLAVKDPGKPLENPKLDLKLYTAGKTRGYLTFSE
jgi:hypothetical protein